MFSTFRSCSRFGLVFPLFLTLLGLVAPLLHLLAYLQAHSSLRPEQLLARHPQVEQRKQRLELQRVLPQNVFKVFPGYAKLGG